MADWASRGALGLGPSASCGEQPGGRIEACVCGAESWRRPDGGAGGFLSKTEMMSDKDVKKADQNEPY